MDRGAQRAARCDHAIQRIGVWLLLASLLAGVGCGGASAPAAPPPAVEEAARPWVAWLQASQKAGFERHDLDAYLAVWTPDATLTVARGEAPGPYDRTLTMAQIRGTRAERFFAPPPQPSKLHWSDVRARVHGDRATIRWIAHSETPGAWERVEEVYELVRQGSGPDAPFRVRHNRLWPIWQMDARRLPIAFDAPTWAARDADVLRHRCDGGPCPEVLLAAWRFEEAWQAARTLTERTADTAAGAAVRWMLRGVCAVVSGHVEDAEPSFLRALQIDPKVELPPWKSAAAARTAVARAAAAAAAAPATLTLYGREGCGICHATRVRLERLGVAYQWRDVDADAADAMWALVRRHHPTLQRVRLPVVQLGAAVMVSPPWRELEPKLRQAGLVR